MFTEGNRIRVSNQSRLDHAAEGRHGTFVEYTPKGYARVALDPKPEWRDKSPDVWLIHPESLELEQGGK